MKTYLLLAVSACIVTITSCTKDADNSASISETSVSSMATSSDGLTLARTAKPNDNGEWKIKMNDVASKAYAAGCKNFPVNSMIVKEKHDASGNITGYDVMYKAPADQNSNDGWLWSQLSPDGHVIYSSGEKGIACQNCHAPDGDRVQHH